MAAQHSVVILKAAFAASLLRPDPTSVPHDEISHFHACLERALSHCSPVNLQICKAWLIRFVAFSSSRVKGLVNYLEALAASLHPQPTGSKVSPKRQRLHILYLLSDLLHHCKYHLDTTFTFTIVTGSLHLHIVNLVSYAATCDRAKNPRHHRRLDDLLDIWSKHDYFHPDLINKLREVVIMGGLPPSNDTANESNPAKKPGKDVPFILPSTHGDPSTPWYDLPAGNLLPHIIPNSTLPIQPESVKPIQLLAGPADKELVDAVKSYLGDVDKLFNPEAILYDPDTDMDEMGQTVIRGENTSDILDGRHYYGWSLDFCQTADSDTEGLRSPSPSRSRSFSQSESESSGPGSYRHGIRYHHDAQGRSRSPRRSPRRSRSRDYRPRESSSSHFPPPHQYQHQSAHTSSVPPAYPSGPNNRYPQAPAPNYGSWPHPQMPTMPFPPPGPVSSSAFPPAYHAPQMQQEQNNAPQMQQGQNNGQHNGHRYGVPRGQHHFPRPYSAGRGGQRGPHPPQGGRGWH